MTAKQKAARAKFKQVVAEAKKLRNKNPKLTQAQAVKQAWAIAKKLGAIKIIEKGESKSARPSATYQQKRTKKGTYAGLKKVGAVKKKAAKKSSSYHKDTKSHNVNIRVVSGVTKAKPSIIELAGKIYKHTERNDHNGSVLLLAKFLKEKKAIELMQNIIKMHNNFGHMPFQLIDLRTQVLNQLLQKFKNKYGQADYAAIYSSF